MDLNGEIDRQNSRQWKFLGSLLETLDPTTCFSIHCKPFAILKARSKAIRIDKANWNEMWTAWKKPFKPSARIKLFNILTFLCFNQNRFQNLISLVSVKLSFQMHRTIDVGLVTENFDKLLTVCARKGDHEMATKVLRFMKSTSGIL